MKREEKETEAQEEGGGKIEATQKSPLFPWQPWRDKGNRFFSRSNTFCAVWVGSFGG